MTADRFSALEQYIQQQMLERQIPSFVAMVWQSGQLVWTSAAGWANRDKRVLADIHTPYLMASVTKPMTATGIMVLAEQGKLDLDAPINDYLDPNGQINVWIGDTRDVTVRSVAGHLAGLPLHSNSYADLNSRPPMDQTIRRYGNIVTPPGERYCYSNIGYGILDYVIERVSGKSYGAFLRSEVFTPLGMHHSFIGGDTRIDYDAAVLYGDQREPLGLGDTDHRGATSAFCSPHDLLQFGLFHMGRIQTDQKPILSPQALTTMQTPQQMMNVGNSSDPNLRARSGYGIGWVIDDDDVDFRVSHGGGFGGTATKLLMLPRQDIVIVTAANAFCPLPYNLDEQVLPLLIPGWAQRMEKRKAQKAQQQAHAKCAATQDEPSLGEIRGEWRGQIHTYEGPRTLTLIVKDNDDVHAKIGDQLWTLVNDAHLIDKRFIGKMQGTVDTADAHLCSRYAFHHVRMDLTHRGDRLCGVMIAVVGRELGHWVDLRKHQA